jgi:hypothetical protein
MRSAILWRIFFRASPLVAAQAGKAAFAALAAALTSAAVPRATLQIRLSSTGERVSKVSVAVASFPSIRLRMPFSR